MDQAEVVRAQRRFQLATTLVVGLARAERAGVEAAGAAVAVAQHADA